MSSPTNRNSGSENGDALIVKGFQGEDFSGIAELARTLYSDSEPLTDSAYLKWKYGENPLGRILAVVESHDEIMGFTGLMPVMMKINGKVCKCAMWGDSMVNQQFRRKGLSMRMHQYLIEKSLEAISMTYATNSLSNPSVQSAIKYLGHRHLGNIRVLRRYISPVSAMRNLWGESKLNLRNLMAYLSCVAEIVLLSIYSIVVEIFDGIRATLAQPPKDRSQISVTEIKPLTFDDEYEQLWNQVQPSFSVALVKSREYLNWRYANPTGRYIGFRAEDDNGNLTGYCIMAYVGSLSYAGIGSLRKLKSACIIDLVTIAPDVTISLVRHALQRAKNDSRDVLVLWEKPETRKASRELALGKSWRKNPFIARLFGPNIPDDVAKSVSDWSLDPGDTEDWI